MDYSLEELKIENVELDDRRKNDLGDVWVGYADRHDESDVLLSDVRLRTTLEGLTRDEVEDITRAVVLFSYESIGKDTFIPSARYL